MKKDFLMVLLAIGFIFAGAISASAGDVIWTLVETAGMKLHSPGPDGLIGTGDDGTSDKCNYSAVEYCEDDGNPTQGAYSYVKLDFVQDMSCVGGLADVPAGTVCTSNADCGTPAGICKDCNTPEKVGLSYFARNPDGGNKGLGTYTVAACEDGFVMDSVSIGTSEVVSAVGGSCMILDSHVSATGCGEGTVSTNYDMTLYTSTLGKCGFNAGKIPGLPLAGRIYAAPTASTGTCGYTTGEIEAIMTDAVLTSGDYLSIMCGNGTLPDFPDLQTVCIPGADWEAVIVAKTTADLTTECASACGGGGCMAGTAEGVE
jgi:hypothetical protein